MDEEEGIVANANANAFVYMFARGVFCAAFLQDKPCGSSFPRHGALVTHGVIGMPAQEVHKDRRLNETRKTWCYSPQSDFPKQRVTSQNGRLTMPTVSYAAVKRL
jgi:hypothetical protein